MYFLRIGLLRGSALADADDLTAITRKINGGLNGFEQRKAILARVKGWLL